MSFFLRHRTPLCYQGHVLFLFVFIISLAPSCTLAEPDTSIRVLSVPFLSRQEVPHRSVRIPGSPVSSSTCGYARVSQVGIVVNKGARAVLKYRIKVRAVTSERLATKDATFVAALSETQRERYLGLKEGYNGGLDIPFLKFLGVDLDDRNGAGKRDESLSDKEYLLLAKVVEKILKTVTTTKIVAKGRLTAKGVSCMRTTAFAFVKIAKLKLASGKKLTVLTTNNDDTIAATRNGDTVLPSTGAIKVLDI